MLKYTTGLQGGQQRSSLSPDWEKIYASPCFDLLICSILDFNAWLSVDFSYCWINLVEAWYSLEQYIGLKEDKLSSTTVDFIRSEGNLETKRLYWFSKPKMC